MKGVELAFSSPVPYHDDSPTSRSPPRFLRTRKEFQGNLQIRLRHFFSAVSCFFKLRLRALRNRSARRGIGWRYRDDRCVQRITQIDQGAGPAIGIVRHQRNGYLYSCRAGAGVLADTTLHVESVFGVVEIDVVWIVVQRLDEEGEIGC